MIVAASWDWGSFTGGILGGLVAAGITIVVWLLTRRQDRIKDERQRAQLVSAWLCAGPDLQPPKDAPIALVFRNAGDSPVYNFRIVVTDEELRFVGSTTNPIFDCFDRVRPPGTDVTRDDLAELIELTSLHGVGEVAGYLTVTLSFTDVAGLHWRRRAGSLERLSAPPEPPADYTGW